MLNSFWKDLYKSQALLCTRGNSKSGLIWLGYFRCSSTLVLVSISQFGDWLFMWNVVKINVLEQKLGLLQKCVIYFPFRKMYRTCKTTYRCIFVRQLECHSILFPILFTFTAKVLYCVCQVLSLSALIFPVTVLKRVFKQSPQCYLGWSARLYLMNLLLP